MTGRSSHAAVALDRQLMLVGGGNDSSLLLEPCVADAVGVQVRLDLMQNRGQMSCLLRHCSCGLQQLP